MPIITIRKLITYLNIMSKNNLIKKKIVLIANGESPNYIESLKILENANYIICCDGAANSLKKFNKIPNIIIGDLDSLNPKLKNLNNCEIIHIENQNNNDFRKALNWISKNLNIDELSILGSTGIREDHTIGNIATFLYEKYNFKIKIFTNTGIFYVVNVSKNINTTVGQQVSLFCINQKQKITTSGLKYELKDSSINLYSGTLNIAQTNKITIKTESNNPILVYLSYENEKN